VCGANNDDVVGLIQKKSMEKQGSGIFPIVAVPLMKTLAVLAHSLHHAVHAEVLRELAEKTFEKVVTTGCEAAMEGLMQLLERPIDPEGTEKFLEMLEDPLNLLEYSSIDAFEEEDEDDPKWRVWAEKIADDVYKENWGSLDPDEMDYVKAVLAKFAREIKDEKMKELNHKYNPKHQYRKLQKVSWRDSDAIQVIEEFGAKSTMSALQMTGAGKIYKTLQRLGSAGKLLNSLIDKAEDCRSTGDSKYDCKIEIATELWQKSLEKLNEEGAEEFCDKLYETLEEGLKDVMD